DRLEPEVAQVRVAGRRVRNDDVDGAEAGPAVQDHRLADVGDVEDVVAAVAEGIDRQRRDRAVQGQRVAGAALLEVDFLNPGEGPVDGELLAAGVGQIDRQQVHAGEVEADAGFLADVAERGRVQRALGHGPALRIVEDQGVIAARGAGDGDGAVEGRAGAAQI